MVLKSVSLRPKAVMFTPMCFAWCNGCAYYGGGAHSCMCMCTGERGLFQAYQTRRSTEAGS